LQILLIYLRTLTLEIWTAVASVLRASFIPVKPKPSKVIFELQSIFEFASLRVEVFNSKYPYATFLLDG
jgi:hypothetical protein